MCLENEDMGAGGGNHESHQKLVAGSLQRSNIQGGGGRLNFTLFSPQSAAPPPPPPRPGGDRSLSLSLFRVPSRPLFSFKRAPSPSSNTSCGLIRYGFFTLLEFWMCY